MISEDKKWNRTRHILAMMYNQNRGKRAYKRPHQLMPLTIDKIGRKGRQWTKAKYEIYEKALKAWGLETNNSEHVQERNSKDPGADNSG